MVRNTKGSIYIPPATPLALQLVEPLQGITRSHPPPPLWILKPNTSNSFYLRRSTNQAFRTFHTTLYSSFSPFLFVRLSLSNCKITKKWEKSDNSPFWSVAINFPPL